MRTVIAPLPREVEAQIDALDRRLAGIARRYIRRLIAQHTLERAYQRPSRSVGGVATVARQPFAIGITLAPRTANELDDHDTGRAAVD